MGGREVAGEPRAIREGAERAVTRGTGFTSELPPPGSTSCRARCRLVIGWIQENGGDFFLLFCIISGRESRACNPRSVPAPLRGGVGGPGWVPNQPRSAFAVGLVKETKRFSENRFNFVLIHPLEGILYFQAYLFVYFYQSPEVVP